MKHDNLDELQRINFASQNGSEGEARSRISKRLSQDRQPSAAASSSTWVNWGAEGEFLGQPWDMNRIPLAKLEQMRRDPILAFALMFVKVPLIRAPWYIKCSDPKIAAATDASLRKIYGRFIMAYCNSFDFGFSPMVKRFEYEENPDWQYIPEGDPNAEEQDVWTNKTVKPLVWKPFTALNPRKCVPHWNSKGEFAGIDFKAGTTGMGAFGTSGMPWDISQGTPTDVPNTSNRIADIPLDWALWATNEKDSVFGSYWGYPRIGYAYRFWWAYWYRFGVADRAFEKWGDPPVLVYHPDDPLALDSEGQKIDYTSVALSLAESVRSGANVALPSGVVTSLDDHATGLREWEITQMQSKTDFSSIADQFRYLDIQKLRAVMVPEQALVEGEGGTSSRNVASTFGDLFQESMTVVKQEIDDHLNRWVIPQFVELNFGKDSPNAEIVTTGFDSMDMDTMKTVLQLVGQRKLLSLVDERELAERMGIPTVTRAEANKRLAEAQAEAEAAAAPETPPTVGPGDTQAAGVSKTGLYYAPQERMVIGHNSTLPYVIERVDALDLEDKPVAYFDTETRVLKVQRDADPTQVKGYLLGLAEKIEKDEVGLPDEISAVLSELQRLSDQVEHQASRDTKIDVNLQNPDPEDPTKYRTRRRVLERTEEGFLVDVAEWKEKIEDEHSE